MPSSNPTVTMYTNDMIAEHAKRQSDTAKLGADKLPAKLDSRIRRSGVGSKTLVKIALVARELGDTDTLNLACARFPVNPDDLDTVYSFKDSYRPPRNDRYLRESGKSETEARADIDAFYAQKERENAAKDSDKSKSDKSKSDKSETPAS